jgi:hypothetical protein
VLKEGTLMKRAILFLLVITAGSIPALAKYSGGTGEPNTPYQIANVADLMTLANDTNDYNKCFIMTADVNLQGQVFNTAIIAPNIGGDPCFIGAPFTGTFFTGTFDGNGHKITNFTISGGYSFIGLFGYISSNGSVKNLGLEGCSFSGFEQVGALCGRNQGGSIANCYSTGTVNGHDRTGGLCGVNEEGSINSSITDCYSTGNVTGSYDTGGLCGYGGNITNCFSTGDVSGNKWTGGLCGAGGDIANCYSTGDVSGNNCTGGLCGVGSNITNCYSTGSVSGNDEYTGGLVGQMYGTISNSCFLDTAGPNNGAGMPLTDTQMKQQSNFTGWDFVWETVNGTDDIWAICEGVSYPKLAWQFIAGDSDNDKDVDFTDFAMMGNKWMQADSNLYCGGTDLTGDGLVNLEDLAALAENWLRVL